MKSLRDFISESVIIEASDDKQESRDFTFDFTDMENAKDTVKSFADIENVSVNDNKVTVTVKKDENLETVQDILQQSIQTLRRSSKSINNETYAQKTAKLERTLGEMNDFIDELNAPDDEDDEDKKENNKKDKKEKDNNEDENKKEQKNK